MADRLHGWFTWDSDWGRGTPEYQEKHGVHGTTDGGFTWIDHRDSGQWMGIRSLPSGRLVVANGGLAFESDQKGLATRTTGFPKRGLTTPGRTEDGGQTWYPFQFPPDDGSEGYGGWSIYYDPSSKQYFTFGQHSILRSSDFGSTWRIDSISPTVTAVSGAGSAVYFATAAAVLRTLNGGLSWDSVGPPAFGQFRIIVPPACQGAVVIAQLLVSAAIGQSGVWMTTSGGDGTIPMPDDTLKMELSEFKTVNACDTSLASFVFSSCGCRPGDFRFDSVRVVGDDRFSVINNGLLPITWDGFHTIDTLRLRYVPSRQVGPATARLHLYGRLIRDSLEVFFDSVVTLNARATATPNLVASTALLNLGEVNLCGKGTIRPITFTNRGCATLTITQQDINASGFTVENLPLPLVLPPDSSVTINVFSLPPDVNPITGSVTLHAETDGNKQQLTFQLLARGVRGPADFATEVEEVDFGTVTFCELDSMLLVMRNKGCDTLYFESAEIVSGAEDFKSNAVVTTLAMGPSDSSVSRISFEPLGLGPRTATFIMRGHSRDGKPLSKTIAIKANVIAPSDPLAVSISSFSPISFCATDSMVIPVMNRSCDSQVIHPSILTTAGDFRIAPTTAVRLAEGETANYTLYFDPVQKGTRTGTLRLRTDDVRFGVALIDTLLPLSGMAQDGDRVLTASLGAIDFGESTICDEQDTTITLTNTGCDTLVITDADVDRYFNVDTKDLPLVIPPGESRPLNVGSVTDTTGRPTNLTGVLTITSTADNMLAQIQLSRSLIYPTRLRIEAVDEASGVAGDEVKFKIILEGDVPKSMTALHFDFVHNNDLLSFESLIGAGLSITGTTGNARQVQSFTLSPVPDAGVVGELTYKVFMATAEKTDLTFENIRFDAEGLTVAPECIAVISDSGSRFTYTYTCGDNTLRRYLDRGEMPKFSIKPNPADNEITIEFDKEQASVHLELFDLMGKLVVSQTEEKQRSVSVPVASIPSGTYYLRVTAGALVQSRRVEIKR